MRSLEVLMMLVVWRNVTALIVLALALGATPSAPRQALRIVKISVSSVAGVYKAYYAVRDGVRSDGRRLSEGALTRLLDALLAPPQSISEREIERDAAYLKSQCTGMAKDELDTYWRMPRVRAAFVRNCGSAALKRAFLLDELTGKNTDKVPGYYQGIVIHAELSDGSTVDATADLDSGTFGLPWVVTRNTQTFRTYSTDIARSVAPLLPQSDPNVLEFEESTLKMGFAAFLDIDHNVKPHAVALLGAFASLLEREGFSISEDELYRGSYVGFDLGSRSWGGSLHAAMFVSACATQAQLHASLAETIARVRAVERIQIVRRWAADPALLVRLRSTRQSQNADAGVLRFAAYYHVESILERRSLFSRGIALDVARRHNDFGLPDSEWIVLPGRKLYMSSCFGSNPEPRALLGRVPLCGRIEPLLESAFFASDGDLLTLIRVRPHPSKSEVLTLVDYVVPDSCR